MVNNMSEFSDAGMFTRQIGVQHSKNFLFKDMLYFWLGLTIVVILSLFQYVPFNNNSNNNNTKCFICLNIQYASIQYRSYNINMLQPHINYC